MIALAIELSSKMGSIALLKDDAVIAEEKWGCTWFNSQDPFQLLPRLLETCAVAIDQVDVFVPGIGPGSFAGTRVAISAARAMALPGGKPVFGQSSGQALAVDVQRETGSRIVVVVGDARRDQVWYAHFENAGNEARMTRAWSLQPADRLRDILPEHATVVSPEWSRLARKLKEACPSTCTLIEQDRFPAAGTLGTIALRRLAAGEPPGALSPIYLHPPVFVEPRFATEAVAT